MASSQAGSSHEITLTIDDLRQLQSTFARAMAACSFA